MFVEDFLMGWYREQVASRLVDWACAGEPFTALRRRVVPRAHGRVLELGAGSGHNARWYDASRVTSLVVVEPSSLMRRRGRRRWEEGAIPVDVREEWGERLTLADASVDSVVITFTLCSVDDVSRVLSEVRRVLRPGGDLWFAEHGRSEDASVARWQGRLDRVWPTLAGGCHLSRHAADDLVSEGFSLTDVERGVLPRTPRWAGTYTLGRAQRQ